MAHSNWEADKMLDVYIYDYLVKKKLHATAKSFMTEGKVAPDPVAIDSPGGFLFEWWSVFWDIFITRTNEKHSESAASYIEAQQAKERAQQQFQMEQLQRMHQAQLQRRDHHLPDLTVTGQANAISSEGMLGQPTVSALAEKMYEGRMKTANTMYFETTQPLFDDRAAHMKSAANNRSQLIQGNPGSVITPLQHMHARMHQTPDPKVEVNTGSRQRSLPMDPSVYGQEIMQSKPGILNSGLNPGVGRIQLKGWPLTGIDLLQPSLSVQYQKALLQNSSQYGLLTQQQQQQLLAQIQAQGNLSNPTMHGDTNSSRIRGLPRGISGAKDGQSTINESSMGSPEQSTSQVKMQQPSLKQHKKPLQQNNQKRKRKGPMSSGPANSTGTGNTVGPSPNSQPSTPSAHTPAKGATMTSNLQHVNGIPKSSMMYAADGTVGVASSTNQLEEDMEHLGDVGSFDDDVESFLSHDDEYGKELFETLENNPSEHAPETSKGFTFSEVGSIRSSNSKVVCCHFSSDGKFLASAGHDRKVVLWNMETLQTESTPEEHTHIITDVRFQPNSTQLATSSFDTTVRLWDATEPNYCLQVYKGHTSHAVSLDFHPKKNDLLCSCDVNNEIRLWNIDQNSCTRVFKGGSTQVRFQPRIGKLLAATSENVVSIFDVEANTKIHSFQGHSTEVDSLCWDPSGEYLASVSRESVKVWSIVSRECIHELSSSGNKFHSCVFHPSYSALLVIGAYQSLELWNMTQNKCISIEAHECVVSGLAQSQVMGMVASTSHDKSVKIWK